MLGVSVLKTGLYQKTDLKRLEGSMTKFTKFLSDDAGDEASELVKMNTSMAGDLIQEVADDVKEVIYDFQRKLRKIRSNYADEASELLKMAPTNITKGLSHLANRGVEAFGDYRAGKMEEERQAAMAEALGGLAVDQQGLLVIEDDDDLRAMTSEMLETMGYRVLAAADVARARSVLERGEKVDLVLSDVVLAGGTSGPDFAEEVRASHPDLPIIFMSGYPGAVDKRHGFLGSDQVLLSKPFQMEQLATAIQEALG